MKRLLISLMVSFAVSFGVSFLAAKYYLDPKLLELVRTKGSEFLKVPLEVGTLKTQLLPLRLELTGVKFEKAEFDGSFASASFSDIQVSADLGSLIAGNLGIVLSFDNSSVLLETADKNKKSEESPVGTSVETAEPLPDLSPQVQMLEQIRSQRKLNLQVLVKNMQVEVRTRTAKSTAKSIQKTEKKPDAPIQLTVNQGKFSTDLKSGLIELKTQVVSPVQQTISLSSNYKINGDWLELSEGKLTVLGLDLLFDGKSNLSDHRQEYAAKANIPDLSKIEIPKDTSCARPEKGALQITTKFTSQAQLKQPNVIGSLNASKVIALVDCKLDGNAMRGEVSIDAKTDFQYALGKLVAPILEATVDGKALSLAMPGKFNKSANDELKFSLIGSATQERLSMTTFAFQFDRIKASGNGSVSLGNGSSRFAIKIEPVKLNGLEKFFPPLQSQPLSGELEVNAAIEGPLEQPDKLSVQLNPIKLTGFQTNFKYTSEDKKTILEGPVQANLDATLQALGSQLSKAKLSGFVNLSEMKIESPQFVKGPKQMLRLELSGNARGQDLMITGSRLTLPSGVVSLDGSVRQPQSPILDLRMSTAGFDTEKMLSMMPSFKDYKVVGVANGNLRIQGRYDFKGGIKTSPLQVSGGFTTQLTQVTVPVVEEPKAKTQASEGKEPPPPPPREPMFEDTPLYRNLSLNLQTTIKSFKYGELTASNLNIKNSISNGVMNTSGQVGQIFDGSVSLKSFLYPLLVRAPTLSTSGSFKELNLDKAITWFSKEYKDMVRGSGSGDFNFVLPDQSRADFYEKLEGNGSAKVRNGFLSTLKFDDLANEKLAKIPGMGKGQKLSTKGASADLDARYVIKGGRLNLDPLNAVTPERNEMRSKGWVTLKEKTCDLEATLFLSDPPVSGSILEANNDGQGRLKIPVRVRGSVFSPDMSIATEVVQTLLTNTAKLEAEKIKKKLTGQGEAKAKELGEELKKEAEKKLKELFK